MHRRQEGRSNEVVHRSIHPAPGARGGRESRDRARWLARARLAAGAAVPQHPELVRRDQYRLLRRERRGGAGLSHDADRARRVGDQRYRLSRVDEPRGYQYRHDPSQVESEQHRGPGRGDGAPAAGAIRATVGGRPIAMRVWIDPDRLAAHNLSPGDVFAALRRNNYLAAVGQTKGNLVQVSLLANTDLRSTTEFENLIVTDRDGAVVRLSDVATVELGAEEPDMIAKFNGDEAVYVGVWPTIGSNEIEVSHRLHAEIARITPTLPPDIQLRVAYDGTIFMQDALKEITKTLMETILIVGIVVFLFLGSIRTALVPLVAMPVSLIGAGVVMMAFGFSLNLLTILAIVLSVGLVVDDAIVVVENVERHVHLGKTRLQAALVGARELVGPIIAMTITLAAVYAPIGFQGGLTGSLFLEFAITLAAAVVVSGIVAVTLSPVMSSKFVHPQGKEGKLTQLVNRGFGVVRNTYARLLDGALQMRPAIVAAAILVMLAAWPLYRYSKRELAPVEDQSHISLFMQVPPDASLAANNRASLEVVKAITAFPEAKFMWSLTA